MPRGWDSQISDKFIINFKGGSAKQIWLQDGIYVLTLD